MKTERTMAGEASDARAGESNLLVCSKCLAALKPGAQFCAQCGQVVTPQAKRCKRRGIWFIYVAAVLGIFVAMQHQRRDVQPPRVTNAAEIATLDSMMSQRIDACSADLKKLSDQEEAAQANRDALAGSLPDIENFRNRLQTAIQRAGDEDRWPVKVAGRQFSKTQATIAIAKLEQYLSKANRSIRDCDRAISQDDAAIMSIQQIRDQLRSHQARIEAGFSAQEFDEIRNRATQLAEQASRSHQAISPPAQTQAVDLDSLLR